MCAFRVKAGWSRNALARVAGVDPSYLTRIEWGERQPSQPILDAVCRSLPLSLSEQNQLLAAGGYVPLSIVLLGGWDDTMQAVTDVLSDPRLAPGEREAYRQVIVTISMQWRARRKEGPRLDERATIVE